MIACKERCDENANSKNAYTSKIQYLNNLKNDKLPFLVISDSKTTGMDYSETGQSNFKAGVRQMGASHKKDGNAGGSHGLGKTVGFVASKCNAVYYSTMTIDGSTYGEGVIRLCEHSISGTEYYADAFYDSHNGEHPDKAMEIPEDFRRTKAGTSVYILGINLGMEDYLYMKQEVLRSFCIAIYNKHLIVRVEGEEFNADNIIRKMSEYLPEDKYGKYDIKTFRMHVEHFNPKPYFLDCYVNRSKDKDHHVIYEATSSKYPHLEHAMFYIYKDETIKNNTDDRILCMRDKEMAIEFRRQNTRKGYYGILICDGEGSKLLRKMENVTHDKWDKTEVKDLDEDTKREANKVLKDIDKFIQDSINDLFPESDDTEYKVPVLNKYLVAAGTRTESHNGVSNHEQGDSLENPQTPVSTIANGFMRKRVEPQKVGRVVIRKRGGVKNKKDQVDDGMGTCKQPVAAPVTPPTIPPTPSTPPVPVTPDPDNPPKEPTNPITGQVGHIGDNGGKHKPTNAGKHTKDITAEFRVVVLKEDSGLVHRIIINSDDNYQSCSMAITIAGEDRDSALRFAPVNPAYRIVGKELNILSDFDLVKGKNYIDIKFEDNDIHSLNIKAYES